MANFRKKWCRVCEEETTHEEHVGILGKHVGKSNMAERTFFGIITLGLTEMGKDRWRECEKCGKETNF